MKLIIEIDMDNDAFQDYNGDEVSRVLRREPFLGRCLDVGDEGTLLDLNGNRCGTWKVNA